MTKHTGKTLSIFFPCYNDVNSIKFLVDDAFSVAKTLKVDHEVIVVDDGSTDGSRELLIKIARTYKKLRLVFHSRNMGYGRALKAGFTHSSKDLVFYTDGDGQYDVRELPLLYNHMTPDIDFVNGIKMVRHDPTYRIILGNLYSMIVRWLFWLPLYDVDCDFRLIRKSLLKRIDITSTSGAVCVELVKKAQRNNAQFRQVSVHHFERKYGISQFFRTDRLFSTLKELLILWFNLMITNNPIFNKYAKE